MMFPYKSVFQRHSFIYKNIPNTISLFYFYITVASLILYRPVLTLEHYDKISPPPLIFFVKYLTPEVLLFLNNITPIICLITALLPQSQYLRIISALFYTYSHAFYCSFGIDSHDQLTAVYGAIALAFMPSLIKKLKGKRMDKHIRIFYFWIFHGAILMPYFISGLTKLFYGGIYQLFFDEISIWSPYAMAYTTERYLFWIGSDAWLGRLIIDNIWISAPMYILATFLEIFSLLPLFFPKLWKPIILKLVIFHIFVNYALNILFLSNTVILLIVLYNTPFSYPLSSSFKEFYHFLKLYFTRTTRE